MWPLGENIRRANVLVEGVKCRVQFVVYRWSVDYVGRMMVECADKTSIQGNTLPALPALMSSATTTLSSDRLSTTHLAVLSCPMFCSVL